MSDKSQLCIFVTTCFWQKSTLNEIKLCSGGNYFVDKNDLCQTKFTYAPRMDFVETKFTVVYQFVEDNILSKFRTKVRSKRMT